MSMDQDDDDSDDDFEERCKRGTKIKDQRMQQQNFQHRIPKSSPKRSSGQAFGDSHYNNPSNPSKDHRRSMFRSGKHRIHSTSHDPPSHDPPSHGPPTDNSPSSPIDTSAIYIHSMEKSKFILPSLIFF